MVRAFQVNSGLALPVDDVFVDEGRNNGDGDRAATTVDYIPDVFLLQKDVLQQ